MDTSVEGMVEIEFIGDPPIIDAMTSLRITMGELPKGSVAVLRAAEARRLKAIPGYSKRVLDPEYFTGLSRKIEFGPDVFTRLVSYRDADIILGSASAHQFRLAGKDALHVELPVNDIALVGEDDLNAAQLRQAIR